MAGNTVDLPQHIQAPSPGTAMLGSNTRVKGQPGVLGTQLDALMFSDGSTGSWIAPNTRTRILGAFMVSATSQGLAQPPRPQPPVPILVPTGDARIRSM